MKVAVLGSGAREHAIAARLAEELGADAVCVTPGGPEVPGSFDQPDDLVAALRARGVDLVIIGPEALLARGVADQLRAAGFSVLGPGEDDARLETSKAFAKDFMTRHRVARALSETVRGVSVALQMGKRKLGESGSVVLKYDGLAAGKGVFVCDDEAALETALAHVETTWGAGAELVLEDRLRGRELSLVAFVANKEARLFPPVEDHKQLHDDDRGPMTGGMGAYYPVPYDSPELRDALVKDIVKPTLRGLPEGYRGLLFFGVMVTDVGPKLLEYNVRFGDPETQVLTVGMGESLSQLCHDAASGTLTGGWIKMRAPAVACVVLSAPGYPEAPELGVPCPLPTGDVRVFHAGTARDASGQLVSSGGRVLSVVAEGSTLEAARAAAYASIPPSRLHHRNDIGSRA